MPYLDYNATSPLRPEVIARMSEVLGAPSNPSSVHSFGRAAKKILEDSRKTIAENIGAFPNEIVFTATGTEANALALRGFSQRRILVSAVEHSSILASLRGAQRRGNPESKDWIASPSARNDGIIPVTASGIINLETLDRMLGSPHPNPLPEGEGIIVSVMLANNETGIIQPIREVVEIAKKHGALVHCDAVQGLGKIPVEFSTLGVDMMTISAHKMGGPVGAAALVLRQNLAIAPIFSGSQELGRRAGTENIAAIAGFAKAVERIDFGQMKKLRGWLDIMEKEISSVIRHPSSDLRLPNTSCLIMPNVSNEVQLMDFDLNGFAVSAGSACSSGRIEPSHVLKAMGIGENDAKCAIRVSGGWNTTQNEIEAFTNAWKTLYKRLVKNS